MEHRSKIPLTPFIKGEYRNKDSCLHPKSTSKVHFMNQGARRNDGYESLFAEGLRYMKSSSEMEKPMK